MRNKKTTQGFTLIELLIVIAIIGILAAVLIPNLMQARTRAFDTASQACAKGFATAVEIWAIDNGSYDAEDGGAAITFTFVNENGGNACVDNDGDGPVLAFDTSTFSGTEYSATATHSATTGRVVTVNENGISGP